MKKRSCRMTVEEREMHERAVRIRKMTDEQLCGYIDSLGMKSDADEIKLINVVAEAKEKAVILMLKLAADEHGIGEKTVSRLWKMAFREGLVEKELI